MTGLSRLDRARSGVGRRLGMHWSRVEAQPDHPQPLLSFRFFGLVTAWMEGDVIAATVANAFAQGCERVYLVDNDSPDDTVAQARQAGAELAVSYATTTPHDGLRIEVINRVVREVSAATSDSHIWWMLMDADEFPHGPGGETLQGYLGALDQRFRAVGARVVHHLPSARPASLPGFHPLDFQPLCAEADFWTACEGRHWKHPLIRWDRGGPTIETAKGFHYATGPACPVREPADGVLFHHFPLRDKDMTRRRLAALQEPDAGGVARNRDITKGMAIRWATLDAAYAGRWDQVGLLAGAPIGIRARPWTEVVPAADQHVARWYSEAALAAAVAEWRGPGAGGPEAAGATPATEVPCPPPSTPAGP